MYDVYFFLMNTKDDIFKNVGNQIVLVTIDSHCMEKKMFLKKERKSYSFVKI